MNKRRLSKQQQLRINKNQNNHLSDDAPNTGRVIARYSRHVDVQPSDQPEITLRCHVRANIESLAVGDEVAWLPEGKGGVIVAVHPRRSVIVRPDGLGKLKPVAANIDQVFIVLAPEPEPHTVLLDRYLLAAENAGINAGIVLNKIDDPALEEVFEPLLDVYRQLDYPVYVISCLHQRGLEPLRAALIDNTSVFAGQSGVGKSSLVNALLPDVETRTGSLSDQVQKGRHTTTTATLFDLPDGGCLIDSPGIREFHLTHLDRQQIFAGFRELQDVPAQCQFRNCQHDQEPGCAVNAFIDEGKMHPLRLQSLLYILNNQDNP